MPGPARIPGILFPLRPEGRAGGRVGGARFLTCWISGLVCVCAFYRSRTFIPSPDAHILFLLIDWEKDASGRYEHKTLINLMKSSSPWLLPGEDGRAVAKGGT